MTARERAAIGCSSLVIGDGDRPAFRAPSHLDTPGAHSGRGSAILGPVGAAPAPKWRNWQTRTTQNRVPVRVCGFDSHLRHHSSPHATHQAYPSRGIDRPSLRASNSKREVMGMAVAARRYRFTVDQYHRMGEKGILDPECRVELINGLVYEMTPIDPWHASVVRWLAQYFGAALGDSVLVDALNTIEADPGGEARTDIASVP